MGGSNFDILTWNVRGLGDYDKRRKIFNWIKNIYLSYIYLVLLQERLIQLKSSKNSGNSYEEGRSNFLMAQVRAEEP